MSDKAVKPDLELLTSDELIDELSRRCHGLVIGMSPKHESDYTWHLTVRGNGLIRQGLGRLLSAHLSTDAKELIK